MSTAQEIMARQIEEQTKELNEYRRRAGPPLPKLEQIKPHQQVSMQELNLLREAQLAGKYDNFHGSPRPVVHLDAAGRPITHYFGPPSSCWDQVAMGFKFIRGFNTRSR
jgi:hypothetical protein